eukprot:333746-Pelagomonas_calceolata.AAC.3
MGTGLRPSVVDAGPAVHDCWPFIGCKQVVGSNAAVEPWGKADCMLIVDHKTNFKTPALQGCCNTLLLYELQCNRTSLCLGSMEVALAGPEKSLAAL